MCWKIEYALLIIASTISVYLAAIFIEKYQAPLKKKRVFITTLLFNAGILFIFKYYNFVNDSLRAVFNEFNIFYSVPELELLLPVGISFYTFQVVGYLADVYKGERHAEKHLGIFAVFVAFFPKLVAGPIERAKNLLPQFYVAHQFNYQMVTGGLKQIAWGLFKKMVIADRLAVYVDQIYNNPGDYAGGPAVLATVFFTIQVYCDFSGYSDIAIGSGQVLGFKLMKNFDRPYHAKSISEFWRRWHISLSSWLNDYIYTPIVTNRRNWGQMGVLFSIFVTFVTCGLWHGANWTFIIWGLLHGLVLSLEVLTRKRRKRIRKKIPKLIYDSLSIVFTFSFVCFSFIFFRANTVADAFLIINNIADISFTNLDMNIAQVPRIELFLAFLSIAILEGVQIFQYKVQILQFISNRKWLFRWTLYVVFISYIMFFRKAGSEFIYFQF